jgi:uncharacterized protein
MSDNPLIVFSGAGAGVFLFWIWYRDMQSNRASPTGEIAHSLPGATMASFRWCLIASLGAILIVIGIFALEKGFNIEDQQSRIRFLFLLPMLGAAITEEVVFRGYLVIRNRGHVMLVASIVFFSILFTLIHPYLWVHSMDKPTGIEWITSLRINISTYSMVSTASIFILSLWYYYVRFSKENPSQSLLPSFYAHTCANLTVFIIKITSGYVT